MHRRCSESSSTMYAVAVMCGCLAVVSAVKVPLFESSPSASKLHVHVDKPFETTGRHDEPEKCCSPPISTFKTTTMVAEAKEGSLLMETTDAYWGYDAIAWQIGYEETLDFSNGSRYDFRFIANYKKGEMFVITTEEGKKVCQKISVPTEFPYNCLGDAAQYTGKVKLGNRALEVVNWYFFLKRVGRDKHIIRSITDPECIDVSKYKREFHPDTGEEILTESVRIENFEYGICDRERYFKLPPECEPERLMITKKIPNKMEKIRLPNGQRLF